MDTITHGIVGALAGKALFAGRDVPAGSAKSGESRALSSPTARAAIVACTLGSMFPGHRHFCRTAGAQSAGDHGVAPQHHAFRCPAAVLGAAINRCVNTARALAEVGIASVSTLFAIYAVGIATHIFLDLVTSFGTMVWSPLRYSRPGLGLGFHYRSDGDGIALVPQLPRGVTASRVNFGPRDWFVGRAHRWSIRSIFVRGVGYGFPIAVVGVVSAIFAVIIFAPAARGAGFRWTRASWCRAGLALCAPISL